MPKEQEDFLNVVNKIIEVVMFENWLRFYFITPMQDEQESENSDPHLFLILSDKALQKIEELYPELLPIALKMNQKELSFELSQQTICTYVVENIDGKLTPRDTVGSIMDSINFQTELELFNTFISLHENQLEQGFADFETWKKLFADWKTTKHALELRDKLFMANQSKKINQL